MNSVICRGLNKKLLKNFKNLANYSTSIESQLPRKLKRDNLTILKALSSSIETNFNSHHRFIEDPFLTPLSGLDKKVCSLSELSGRDAAHFVFKKFPKNFNHDTSFPQIEAFKCEKEIVADINTEAGLKERIKRRMVLESYESYMKIKDSGNEINENTFNDLLDLLCFSNSQPFLSPSHPDQRYFFNNFEFSAEKRNFGEFNQVEVSDQSKTFWKKDGPADKLFKELKHPSSRQVSSIIKGRIKYNEYDQALEEYKKAIKKKMKLVRSTHNSLLSSGHIFYQEPQQLWAFIINILTYMRETQTSPNANTFNNCLLSLSKITTSQLKQQYLEQQKVFHKALSLIGEMKKCFIKPTLTTWTLLTNISYCGHGNRGRILHNIVQVVSEEQIFLTHPSDLMFFSNAMLKCYRNVKDVSLAKQLFSIVNSKSLDHFLGNYNDANFFFTNYLNLLIQFGDLDSTVHDYSIITPHAYAPTFKVLDSLLKLIDQQYAFQHLSRIWADMKIFKYTRRKDLVERFFEVLSRAPLSFQKEENEYLNMVIFLQKQISDDLQSPNFNKPFDLSGKLVSSLLVILENLGLFQKSWELVWIFVNTEKKSSSLIREDPLKKLTEHFISLRDEDKTKVLLKVMADYGYASVENYAKKACKELPISSLRKSQLMALLD